MDWELHSFRGKPEAGPRAGQILRGGALRCAYCKGTGLIPNTRGSKCHICKGEGDIIVEGPAVRCPFCNGRGTSERASRVTCPVCKGKGIVPVVEPVDTCPSCQGKGKELGRKPPCRACKGSGVVAGSAATVKGKEPWKQILHQRRN